jgi:hypothetical protein
MDAQLSWNELFFLTTIAIPAAYLKIMSEFLVVKFKLIVEIGFFQGCTSQ